MNYFKAMKIAITHDWSCGIKDDAICGNGFQVAAYGIKLSAGYLLHFIFRVVFAVLFPFSAFIVLRIKAYDKIK